MRLLWTTCWLTLLFSTAHAQISFWDLINKAESVKGNYPDSAFFYLNQSMTVAENQDDPYLKAWSQYYTGYHLRPANLDSAKSLVLAAHRFFNARNVTEGSIMTLNTLSYTLGREGKYDSALLVLSKATHLIQELETVERYSNIKYHQANLMIGFSRANRGAGDFVAAADYALKGLRLANDLSDNRLKYLSLRSVAQAFYGLDDLSEEKKYCLQALEIAISMNETKIIAEAYNNLGIVYSREGKYDSALFHFTNSLDFAIQRNDKINISDRWQNVAIAHYYKQDYDQAIRGFKRSIEVADEINYVESKLVALVNMSDVYYQMIQYDSATKSAEAGLDLAIKTKRPKSAKNAYYALYDVHKALGNYDLALDNFERYTALRDSLISERNLNRIKELELAYETEKKEREIAELTQLATLQKAELRQQNIFVLATVIIFLLIAALLYIYYRQRSLKQRQENLEIKQRLLRVQMNPHFFFNALSSIQSELYEAGVIDSAERLSQLAGLMRKILEYSQEQQITLQEELNFINNYLEMERSTGAKCFEYKINVAGSVDPEFVAIPPMITQPFLENAIKHGFKDQERVDNLIELSVENIDGILRLVILDNGVGLNKSFQNDHTSMSTSITYDRLKLLRNSKDNTSLHIADRQDTKGTKIEITLPIIEL